MSATCVISYKNGDEQRIYIPYPFCDAKDENGWLYVIGYKEKVKYVQKKFDPLGNEDDFAKLMAQRRNNRNIESLSMKCVHTNTPNFNEPYVVARIRLKTIRGYRFE